MKARAHLDGAYIHVEYIALYRKHRFRLQIIINYYGLLITADCSQFCERDSEFLTKNVSG